MTLSRRFAPRLLATLLLQVAGMSAVQAAAGWPAELPQQPVEVRDAAMLQVISADAKLEDPVDGAPVGGRSCGRARHWRSVVFRCSEKSNLALVSCDRLNLVPEPFRRHRPPKISTE